jgi:hypothetical protein
MIGLGLWGCNGVQNGWLTSCAPLACMTLIEWRTSADAVGLMSGKGKKEDRERRRGGRTNAALAIPLVNAEHSDISPEVPFTMGCLLAYDNSDGVRDALSICLWNYCECMVDDGYENIAHTRKER